MASTVDRAAIVDGLAQASALLPEAMTLGRTLAPHIDRIYLVAAGSANRAMLGLQYWIERDSPSLEVRRYFPAELMAQDPRRLDPRTLVLLASKSGTTPETVAAAEWLRGTPCRTVGFTQREDRPLAGLVDHRFIIGETAESFTGLFMAMQSLVGGLLAAKDGWALADTLLTSLQALPGAIADAAAANEARGAAEAQALRDQRVLYHVASGPGFTTAYVFGVCIVMEMLWLHSTPLEAAEFFHGPFEVVDADTRLVLLLGEDPSRPLMERVVRFCRKHTDHLMIYDSRDYAMPGIDPAIRPIVAPYVLQAALKRISANLSDLLGKPLGERRYMWKTEY
ncbi:SIS domain-containing protein [Limobrevibacterium gyesilva]|uniref:SIS domain-containing protein n=1 Tax=Limobrevibacterium gyesilva TaxID=2991712 RepID=A0AA42CHZ7_9PROT|nr:SIS domain-containing protein [Limobrevibacterium gyesilva]MCW3475385.1 SIS domain-containing protein [Limobrevibacterium gyesilva]